MNLKSELSFLQKLILIVFKIRGILLVKSKFLNSIGPLKKKGTMSSFILQNQNIRLS